MKKLYVIVIMILSVFIISGCSTVMKEDVTKSTENSSVMKMTAKEAKAEIDKGDVIILDVRTNEEYISGHIENSILIPVNEIEKEVENILKDKEQKVLIYCRSGNRSSQAAKLLVKMGYTNVYDFGGIKDWPYEIVK
ncbi:rhodanese-like domain-containing protein [uncultured Clostridium sp.]|uniref:rhodanese-like domain-containing protein n=1 Tax=uncultured Clostridium sp. TaxID=59620 RepID=UPI00280BD07F|nr:rhodanese-like domain-containing protein [uncultured Clostridium sp.]